MQLGLSAQRCMLLHLGLSALRCMCMKLGLSEIYVELRDVYGCSCLSQFRHVSVVQLGLSTLRCMWMQLGLSAQRYMWV